MAEIESKTDAPQAGAALPSRFELVIIIAGLMALNAMAIDIMLPGLRRWRLTWGCRRAKATATIASN